MEGDYNSRLNKMQKEEYLIKNACYSVTKYYLCKQNNKRSLLGRKQRSQVARSFPNRYQFSCTNKVTSLFSISCSLRIILGGNSMLIADLLYVNVVKDDAFKVLNTLKIPLFYLFCNFILSNKMNRLNK